MLHLPRLATDRIRQREPDLAGVPIAAWDMQGNRRLLTGVDAPGTTLHVGQALADAQAMHPAGSPSRRSRWRMTFLERLALWAIRFTPIAAIDPPDGLVLDVTGCTRLFGGEPAMLARVGDSLQRGGVAARPSSRASRMPLPLGTRRASHPIVPRQGCGRCRGPAPRRLAPVARLLGRSASPRSPPYRRPPAPAPRRR